MTTPSRRSSVSSLIKNTGIFISRSGRLHRVVSVEEHMAGLKIFTKCGQCISIRNSRRSRSARWLKKGWMKKPCKECKMKDAEINEILTSIMKVNNRTAKAQCA
jgi:pyrrolysyl-tRNA synthetase